MSAPLLSICIPAYNRPELLRDCLATVVPQAARYGDQVECVVCDDASPQDLNPVARSSAGLGQIRYVSNPANMGCQANVYRLTTELAMGEYVWLLGDDDTLKAGGLDHVMAALAELRHTTDVIVLNFDHVDMRCRPPTDCLVGGVLEIGAEPVRRELRSGLVRAEDLLDGKGGAFTPMYTLVIRRALWQPFVARHPPEAAFRSVACTYPHAVLIAETMVGRPIGYVAEPVLTLFEVPHEQFWWSRHAPVVLTVRFLELLRTFLRHGLSRSTLEREYAVASERVRRLLPLLVWSGSHVGGLATTVKLWGLLPGRRRAFIRAVRETFSCSAAPKWARWLAKLLMRLKLAAWRMLGRPGVEHGGVCP